MKKQFVALTTIIKAMCLLMGLLLAGCVVIIDTGSNDSTEAQQTGVTTVYLTRHAEKGKGSNPDLTEQGQQTAKRLATYFNRKEVKIKNIHSTSYNRTLQTAEAVATRQNVKITETNLAAHEMARLLINDHQGQNVLVVGHSNTTPALISALGVKHPVVIKETDYGQLFVVRLKQDKVVEFYTINY